MLKLLDKYPMWTEYKEGNRQMSSKRLIITTNIPPLDWYPGVFDKSMLHRRFSDYCTFVKCKKTKVSFQRKILPYKYKCMKYPDFSK